MSGIDLSSIIAQMQAGQNSANAANQQRYQQGMGALRRSNQQARSFYDEAVRQSNKTGRQAREDVNVGAKQLGASSMQGLISSGLGNTTITGAMMRGVESQRQRGLANAAEAQANRMMGLSMDRGGLEYDMGGRQADFIASRYDNAPDPLAYAGLLSSAAAAQQMPSAANPVTISGGLGPMASAGLTGTGRPMGWGGSGGGGGVYSSMMGGGGGGGNYQPGGTSAYYIDQGAQRAAAAAPGPISQAAGVMGAPDTQMLANYGGLSTAIGGSTITPSASITSNRTGITASAVDASNPNSAITTNAPKPGEPGWADTSKMSPDQLARYQAWLRDWIARGKPQGG